ncbi:sigma-70 family RNA polymerase sigma factor [Pontibacter diazotrophicus]|uniref:Sigma-70 family RNA polymerase sigma factor n=1 Tax=Pontibacter diazotrophicus TaxID=1400979 RepID=A0A3D8L7E3_9BACT|nr:sigma-70 family RNA polymerase sigma factor [Pontibacter diazotrophicus]RDV13329.1 sigma-70 family RNA polymerase sigma factor [Pontibacter diazotrophicus]
MEQQKLKGKNPYAGESIQDILLVISYKDQYPDEYQYAFIEFHQRYMEFIYKACIQACKFFSNPSEFALDLSGNVFLVACERAVEFEPREGYDEEIELKAWLLKIMGEQLKSFTAHNPERKAFFSVDRLPTEPESEADTLEENDVLQEDDYPISRESVRDAMESLKTRDKDIVMAYLTHVHRKNAHLPDEIMQGLCSKYNTTSFNVRQVKQRFFKKVRMLNGGNA